MIERLRIENVAIVERAELEFGPGLNVLTGETGAGKSILLDALGLALGGRAESGMVRPGAAQASVTAEFTVPGDHPVFDLLREQGVPVVEMERVVGEAGLRKNEAFLDLYHPTARVHRLLAEELVRVLRPRIPAPADSARLDPPPRP